jgi:hypothetical protein
MLNETVKINSIYFMMCEEDNDLMFFVTCKTCGKLSAVGYRRFINLNNTDDGPIGVFNLPCGHTSPHEFRSHTC